MPGAPGWGIDPELGSLVAVKGGTPCPRRTVPNVPGTYQAFYAGVRDAIRGTGTNPVPPEAALAVMRVLEAGLRSARERREVSLSE